MILADGDELQADCLEFSHTPQPAGPEKLQQQADVPIQTLDEMECSLVKKAIDQCSGNLSQAAAQLGITRQTLYNKMKRYGL